MPWLQLIVDVGDRDPQPIETALFAAGALAVTLRDAADKPVLEPPPGETPLWNDVTLVALFESQASPDAIRDVLLDALASRDLPTHRFETLADRAWEREWEKDFRPMRFGSRLWICPHGQTIDPAIESPVVIHLDPGLGFGTGTHPTTRLCLTWLDQATLDGKTVIDYGCGSGILSIAAAKLGARKVLATDIDEQAMQASRDNAVRNGVSQHIDVAAPGGDRPWHCDILLANILAGTLHDLAQEFAGMTNRGGSVVLSGILDDQADTVLQTYSQWFDMLPPMSSEGWSLLVGSPKIQ